MPFAFLIFIIIFGGCQANQKRLDDYNNIELGMRKRDVLDVAGNPRFTDRRDSVDRWYYYLVPEDPKSVRVVHFKENIVIYKGEHVEPSLTAAEADALKEPEPPAYIRTLSDEELKEMIKKDIRKEKKKKKEKPQSNFEKI